MCCIFTCCGWMIDLIQRLWTFTMSCCISSAVCCALLTGAMAGIALGYNYSLAEYVDLKETNVSVYLKRGIFDDEIGDDMEWRRSGHQAVAGHIGEQNLRTGEFEEDSSTLRSGRRLDDSILESDYRHQFEGSLMKLTAKAPAPTPITLYTTTIDTDKIIAKYSMGSLDQMKALQSLINMKKSVDPRLKKGKEETEIRNSQTPQSSLDDRYLPHGPINPNDLVPGRKHMVMPPIPGMSRPPSNSARYAVPQEPLNEQAKWKYPRLPPEAFTRDQLGDFDVRPTFPVPVTLRAGPVRPTRPKPTRPRPTLTAGSLPVLGRDDTNYAKSIDEDIDTFKDKMLFEPPSRFKEDDFMKEVKAPKPEDEDYGERVKGIPIRKRRHVIFDKFKNVEINKSSASDSSTENIKTEKTIDNIVFNATKTVTSNISSIHDPSTIYSKTNNTRDSSITETFRGVDMNKLSIYNSSTDNPKDLNANNNSLLNRLRKSLSEFLNTSYKLRVTKNPEESISKMSSSSTVLKILQTI